MGKPISSQVEPTKWVMESCELTSSRRLLEEYSFTGDLSRAPLAAPASQVVRLVQSSPRVRPFTRGETPASLRDSNAKIGAPVKRKQKEAAANRPPLVVDSTSNLQFKNCAVTDPVSGFTVNLISFTTLNPETVGRNEELLLLLLPPLGP